MGLGVAFLAVCTVTSVALLEGTIEDTTVIGPTFGYIESFFSDIFVFTVTGENYPDVVYVMPAAICLSVAGMCVTRGCGVAVQVLGFPAE